MGRFTDEANFIIDGGYIIGVTEICGETRISIPIECKDGTVIVGIGNEAFKDNEAITDIIIPDSVKTIGEGAFSSCIRLKNINIEGERTVFGKNAFENCVSLEKIYFNVVAAEHFSSQNRVFANAGGDGPGILVIFGPNVKVIPANLFNPCNDPEYAPKILKVMFECDSMCESISTWAFAYLGFELQVILPISVTTIASDAFYSVAPNFPFAHIYYLAEEDYWRKVRIDFVPGADLPYATVYCYSETIPLKCGKFWHYNVSGEISIWNVMESNMKTYSNGLDYAEAADGYVVRGRGDWTGTYLNIFPDYNGRPVLGITFGAFENDLQITDAYLPDSITFVNYHAFYGCKNLRNVRLSKGLKNIFESAFEGCSSLVGVNFPGSLTLIGERAFAECVGISKVEFPRCAGRYSANWAQLKSIGKEAFIGCENLTQIDIPEKVNSIDKDAFSGCITLEHIDYNAERVLNHLRNNNILSNSGCVNGIEMVVGENVARIPECLFRSSDNIISVEIHNRCRSKLQICPESFGQCERLSRLNVHFLTNELIQMIEGAFVGCKSLEVVSFDEKDADLDGASFTLSLGEGASREVQILKN